MCEMFPYSTLKCSVMLMKEMLTSRGIGLGVSKKDFEELSRDGYEWKEERVIRYSTY